MAGCRFIRRLTQAKPRFFEHFLDQGAYVDVQSEGDLDAPLHLVAGRDSPSCRDLLLQANGSSPSCCELLLQRNASVNALNATQQTPLIVAVTAQDYGTAHCLLMHGANPNSQDYLGISPMHIAAGDQTLDALNLLDAFSSKGWDLSLLDEIGWTPLHYAAVAQNSLALQWLLDRGQDSSAIDDRG